MKRAAIRIRNPYLRPNRFQGIESLKRKENSPRGSRRRLRFRLRCRFTRERAAPHPGSEILIRCPFGQGDGLNKFFRKIRPSKRFSPLPKDRLTHVQLLFTWNPSPLQSSRFSLEYLLLPPRSARETAPAGLAPKPSAPSPRPPTSCGISHAAGFGYGLDAGAPSIVRASCFGR